MGHVRGQGRRCHAYLMPFVADEIFGFAVDGCNFSQSGSRFGRGQCVAWGAGNATGGNGQKYSEEKKVTEIFHVSGVNEVVTMMVTSII